MTNKDWLNEIVPEVSQGIKDAIMVAREVDPAATYSTSDQNIELAEADLYMRMTRISSFTEGALSVKYDLSSLKEQANAIYLSYGDPKYDDGIPKIRKVKL